MSKNVSLMGADYPDVPAVVLPQTGGGSALFTDVSQTTATEQDVEAGKVFYKANGERAVGTMNISERFTLQTDTNISSDKCTLTTKESVQVGNLAIIYLVFTPNSNLVAGQDIITGLPIAATNRVIVKGYDNTASAEVSFTINTSGILETLQAITSGNSIRIAAVYASRIQS